RPDLIVLDVMLPDLDGFEVARRLRQTEGAGTRVPVIFLTARDTTADKVEGLRLGSDDYVTKPFSIEELIERVKAVLRRSTGAGPGDQRITYADLVLDEDTREVWRDGRPIDLTATEYKLLHYLLANARRALPQGRVAGRAVEVVEQRHGGDVVVGNALGDVDGHVEQHPVGHDVVHQAALVGLGGTEPVAGEAQLPGPADADGLGQERHHPG